MTYVIPEHAVRAYTALDGTAFQGRMLHLLAGKSKTDGEDAEGYYFFTVKIFYFS